MITYDPDFLRLDKERHEHCGIAYCDQGRRPRREIIRRIIAMADRYSPEEMMNRIEYL